MPESLLPSRAAYLVFTGSAWQVVSSRNATSVEQLQNTAARQVIETLPGAYPTFDEAMKAASKAWGGVSLGLYIDVPSLNIFGGMNNVLQTQP